MNTFEKLYGHRQRIYNDGLTKEERFRKKHDNMTLNFYPEIGQIIRENASCENLSLTAFITKCVLFYTENKNE